MINLFEKSDAMLDKIIDHLEGVTQTYESHEFKNLPGVIL